MLEGIHRRSVSSWQNTQRNLSETVSDMERSAVTEASHATSSLRERIDD